MRRAAAAGDRGVLEAIRAGLAALEPSAEAAAPRARLRPRRRGVPPRIARGGRQRRRRARCSRDLNDRIRILRIHDFTTDDRVGATIAEHLEIVGAVLAGDADAAAAFMRAHVQRSALVVRERVGEALARMAELDA